tara:strand:- start:318 stop:1814 length:1497 start_codon:yes stop_codon:yes gene_type:complete
MKIESLKQLISEELTKATNEGKRPDYPDVDKDGDREESMEKALKDKKTAGKEDVKESSLGEVKGETGEKRLDDLLDIILKYVEDPDNAEEELANYRDRGYPGFSDMLKANLDRDLDFQTWVQVGHDRGLEEDKSVNEGSMSDLDALAKESENFKDFIKKILSDKEYNGIFDVEMGKNKKTLKYLKDVFNTSKEESLEEGHTDIENEKLKVISKELKSASKLHKGQAKKLDKITNESVKEAYADLSDEERLKVGIEYDHETIAQAYLNKMGRDSNLKSDDLLKIGKKVVFLNYDGDLGAAYKDLVKEDINEARGFTTKELRLKSTEILRSLGIQIDDSTVMDMVKTLMDTINKNTAGVVLTNEAHNCATTHPDMSHEEYETSLNEDMDLGHEDNEPHMIKADLYRIGKYSMDLYKMVNKFDQDDVEVDFPSWWQSKIFKAKDALVGAKHYLDFELKEPEIDAMVDVASEEEIIDEEFVNITPNEESGEAVEAESDGPGY